MGPSDWHGLLWLYGSSCLATMHGFVPKETIILRTILIFHETWAPSVYTTEAEGILLLVFIVIGDMEFHATPFSNASSTGIHSYS